MAPADEAPETPEAAGEKRFDRGPRPGSEDAKTRNWGAIARAQGRPPEVLTDPEIPAAEVEDAGMELAPGRPAPAPPPPVRSSRPFGVAIVVALALLVGAAALVVSLSRRARTTAALARGRVALAGGEWDRAVEAFELVLAIEPGHLEAGESRAFADKRARGATAALTRRERIGSRRALVAATRRRVAETTDPVDRAAIIDRALAADPDATALLILRGVATAVLARADLAAGRTRPGLAGLERAATSLDRAVAQAASGAANERDGSADPAELAAAALARALLRLVVRGAPAAASVARAVEAAPAGSTTATLAAALAAIVGRRFADARARLDATEDLDPRTTAALPTGRATLALLRAEAALGAGDLVAARDEAELALALAPDHGRAHALHAAIAFEGGGDPRERAERAVALGPLDAFALGVLARVHAAAGRRADAQAAIDRACRSAPDDAGALLVRADLRAAAGDPASAARDLDRVLELDPDRVDALIARGAARVALSRPAEARADLDRAVALSPDRAATWAGRAAARRAAGDLGGAAADLERARAQAPTDRAILFELGRLHHGQGDQARAVDAFSAALAVRGDRAWPEAPTALGLRARARLGLSPPDPRGALADLEEALRADPRLVSGWELRSRAWEMLGEPARALDDLRRFVELRGGEAAVGADVRDRLRRLERGG